MSSELSYFETSVPGKLGVRLERKTIGYIKHEFCSGTESGYRYYPVGNTDAGELFPTLEECKRNLEGDEDE